jgi:membrane protease YdiL (CAAX protease family)
VTALPVAPAVQRDRRSATTSGLVGALLVLATLGAAVAMRVAVAGDEGPGSIRAGLVFAAVLAAVAVVARARTAVSLRAFLIGLAGAAAIAIPAVVVRGFADVHPVGQFLTWGAATTLVAVSEEAVLRGALFVSLARWRGPDLAVVGAALAFALLHVPLYGWHVMPLDLAVGLLLGALRLLTGTWLAPAVAHLGADLIGWWTV